MTHIKLGRGRENEKRKIKLLEAVASVSFRVVPAIEQQPDPMPPKL